MTRRGLLLFIGLSAAWGIPYALTKIAVGELTPQFLVLARTSIAAAVLLPLALARQQLRPALRHWRPVLAFSVIEICVPWFFLNAAQQRLPSATVGLILATVPLAGLAVAFAMGRREPMAPRNWVGIVLGLLGVAAIVGLGVADTDLVGVALMLVVITGYAIGPAILARYASSLPGTGVMALALSTAAVAYVPIVLVSNGVPRAVPSTSVIICVLILALVCSAAAFLIMFALVDEVGPVRMTTITYVNPAVAVIAGAVLLREPITVWTVVGFVLVISGSALVQRSRGRPTTPPTNEGGATYPEDIQDGPPRSVR